MDIKTYIQKSLATRQAHIDLSDECIPVVLQRNTSNGVKGDYTSAAHSSKEAKETLLQYLSIEKFGSRYIHTCHLCKNDSSRPNGFTCANPKHLYFGTASENHNDKSIQQKKAMAKAGGKSVGKINAPKAVKTAIKNGNHTSQQKAKCIYCGKESNPGNIKQWHNERCKHKPLD